MYVFGTIYTSIVTFGRYSISHSISHTHTHTLNVLSFDWGSCKWCIAMCLKRLHAWSVFSKRSPQNKILSAECCQLDLAPSSQNKLDWDSAWWVSDGTVLRLSNLLFTKRELHKRLPTWISNPPTVSRVRACSNNDIFCTEHIGGLLPFGIPGLG